ncbi:AAA family ATPase [Massilia sp. PAMC28688]|uniref:3'-5' exonuclease n=1 Tax=Massilia sp. PAMC28688 TaxID=2861283 RepID=UPI001C626364|nr:3'-5' exonuclease [Massilia sp. PAMC28688]QYF91721.1 AAA family ATPase [Massilia sp. PAMC28688]
MTQPDAPRFVPRNLAPTAEQSAIQLSRDKVVVIKANAGAAKTTTLALRIGEALARGLGPEHILTLTFTVEARDVLKRRLLDVGIPAATAARLRVATFNEFALQTLEQIEQRKVPQISSIKDLKPYVDEALQQVSDNYGGKIDYFVSDTSTAALSQFFHAQLELKATLRLQADLTDLTQDEVADVLGVSYATVLTIQEYERHRVKSSGDVLFRGPFDATYDLAVMLDGGIITRSQLPRSRIILCDELHDLNEASFHLLQHLIEADYTYFIGAGDIDQVIHSRLGASDTFMRSRFTAAFPGTASYPLTFSFRHGPHLAFAAGAFKQKPSDSLLPLHTGIFQRHYDGDATSCADQVVASVKRWTATGHPIEDCAVLVREPHQAIAIENALMRARVPYRTLEMPRYLDREEILFLRGMIAIALNNFSDTDKSKRGAIFDAVATFAEVSFSRDDNVAQLRQAVIDEPVALNWLFSGRVDQRKSKDVRDRVAAAADELIRTQRSQEPDLVLGALRQQLASLQSYVQGDTGSGADSTLQRALSEVDQDTAAMIAYLEQGAASMDPQTLLDMLRNLLLTLVSKLDQLVAGDVKERMAGVIAYMTALAPDTAADVALRHICARMDVEALARRLFVHPHEARVVSRSIAGFIKAAEAMQMNLRQFSEWIAAADQYGSGKRVKGCVQLDCVRNVKGKEFQHVILPFLEVDEFPFARADRSEEDNLFYVAITRAIAGLTLISPSDAARRSPFIARMQIEADKPRAQAAVSRNEARTSAPGRIEFKTSPADWARARELGAHWDGTRKVFYLVPGQSAEPFAEWLGN